MGPFFKQTTRALTLPKEEVEYSIVGSRDEPFILPQKAEGYYFYEEKYYFDDYNNKTFYPPENFSPMYYVGKIVDFDEMAKVARKTDNLKALKTAMRLELKEFIIGRHGSISIANRNEIGKNIILLSEGDILNSLLLQLETKYILRPLLCTEEANKK